MRGEVHPPGAVLSGMQPEPGNVPSPRSRGPERRRGPVRVQREELAGGTQDLSSARILETFLLGIVIGMILVTWLRK